MRNLRIPALVAAVMVTAGAGLAVAQDGDAGKKAGVSGTRQAAVKAPFLSYYGDLVTVPAGQLGSASAYCPSGMVAVSGGFVDVNISSSDDIARSFLVGSLHHGTYWEAIVRNTNVIDEGVRAQVVCTTP
ncbi:hypothetical protein AB0C52_14425 [Streptomyces sp. NPDC048717]|uniref:hypothetical protein n=1 Tax=unclassified Streptomyces TaxID=2593676 RepID=UPI0034318D3F